MIRRANGSRITGWRPEAIYVGYLVPPQGFGLQEPPATCPNCGATLIQMQPADRGGDAD